MAKYQIKDLKPGMKNIKLTAKVDFLGYTNKGQVSYGDSLYVQAYVKDETGEIKMTFWEEDARLVKEGKKLTVTKAYTKEYRGELQLAVPEDGKIEFL